MMTVDAEGRAMKNILSLAHKRYIFLEGAAQDLGKENLDFAKHFLVF